MLEVRDLSVSYGQHRALEGASVHVGRGEIVVILGANGAGKSSLLKAICGTCEGRVAGSVRMQGEDLLGLAPDRIVEAGIALVPEGRGVFPDLTVRENLTLGAYSRRARDEEEGNLARVLALFPKLAERGRQVVRTMSGGEQQMVAIGRAMMSAPAVLTLDEPSLGLSPLLCRDLFQAIRAVRDTGIGVLLVEQNARQSLAIADRGYLIENGRIVHEAPAEALRNDPAVQKAYLGGGGAAAPVTHRGTAAAPARAATPIPPRPPATPGASPAEIAAAAIAGFSRRPAAGPAPAAPRPEPPPRPAPAAPEPARAVPPPPAAGANGATAGKTAHGIAVGDLVARAAARSAASVSPRAVPPRVPAPPRRPEVLAADLRMPDPADSRDRLQRALREIEDAAARARAWRPDRNR